MGHLQWAGGAFSNRRRSRMNDSNGPASRVESLEIRRLFAADLSVIDPNFGAGGAGGAVLSFYSFSSVVQADGKTVVVGGTDLSFTNLSNTHFLTSTSRVAVERFNPDGTVDPTFNNGQELLLDPSGTDESGTPIRGPSQGNAVTVDPQGRILVAGIILDSARYAADNQHAVLVPFVSRLTAAGQVDPTFVAPIGAPHDASATMLQNLEELPRSIIVLPDGHVLLAGLNFQTGQFAALIVLRDYRTDGTPEATFGSGTENQPGLVVYPAYVIDPSRTVAAAFSPSEGAIYLAGTTIIPEAPFLLKVTTSGALFPGFHTTVLNPRMVAVDSFRYRPGQGIGAAVALQPDGKVVVAGETGPNVIDSGDHISVARFLPDGEIDRSFGAHGVSSVAVNRVNVSGISVQPDGQIDVAGTADDLARAVLAAFNPDGSPDKTFAPKGLFYGSLDGGPAIARAAVNAKPGGTLRPLSLSSIVQGVLLALNLVPDGTGILGEVVNQQTVLRKIRFDHTAPAAAILPGAGIAAAGVAAYSFTVNYTDNDKVASSSLGNANLVVTGPNGYNQAATLVGTSGSGRSVSATYQVTPPAGTWSTADTGAYTIALRQGQVADAAGNTADPTSAQFPVFTTLPPTSTPTAQRVLADQAKLANDLQAQAGALAADKSAASASAAADKATLAADNARIKADRGNAPLLVQDKSQLAADKRQARTNTAAAKAKLRQDKASYSATIKLDKSQLKADQRLLRKGQ